MPGLPSAAIAAPDRHSCELSLRTGAEEGWSGLGGERLFDLTDADGRVVNTLDFEHAAGARVWGLERGSFFVEPGGSRIRCHPDEVEPWQWRRFLVGQVLPLAALLHGFEILHASAVVVGGEALVLTGSSRSGKTSVAARLVLDDALFLTDDVVALEQAEDAVLAHPGTPMLGLRHDERSLWPESDLNRLGVVIAERATEQLVVPASLATDPYPVAGVYLLDRSPTSGPLAIEQVPDPRYLLASSFNNVLRTSGRLIRMLDVHGALSRSAGVYRVSMPDQATATDVAAAVADHHRTGAR
jgi:hypothetical protein